MEMIRTAGLVCGAFLLTCGGAQADDYDWEDIFSPYRQRIDAVTPSAGNAQNVNAATHVITPWPPYVHNRRIPGDGTRMVGAIERYHNPNAAPAASQPQGMALFGPSGGSGSSNGTGEAGQGTTPSGQSGQPAQ